MTFDEWRNMQDGPIDTEQAARNAFETALIVGALIENKRCKEKCEELASDEAPTYKDYEDTYLNGTYINGWLDACNECGWAIHGCVPKNQVFTEEEIIKAASIGKAYFEENRPK